MENDPYSAAASLRAVPRAATMGAPDYQTMDQSPYRNPSYQSPLNRPEKSRSGESRFSPSATFEYNGRIAIALVPCAVLLLEMGGVAVMATLTVGLMISYILDALQLKQGAFFGIWSTLIISQLAFVLGGSLLSADPAQLQQVRIVNGAIALVVVTVCLEIRVVFYSFGRYLHVAPPWNYVLVTITMLGGASAAGAYGIGLVSSSIGSAVFTGVTILVSLTGSLVVGMPLKFLPAPIVAGFYISQFFTKKSLSSYFIFVISASLPVAWFVVHNYWSLNIWLAGMALKSFCKFIIASAVLAMAIPGLVLLPSKAHFVTEFGLMSHALLVCYLENQLYNYSSIYYFGFDDDVMYPSYMVITTTVLGLALVRRLALDNRIGPKAVWILTCLYAAKLSMLFLTSKTVLWVAVILLLAISPPLLLYKEKSKAGSKMKPWQAFSHATVIALSVWYCRNTIFEALQWWNGRPPPDALLLGFIILLSGLGCIPIVARHFSHILLAKRVLLLVVVVGVLFIFMQPPIPDTWSFQSNFTVIPESSVDDITIYGSVEKKPSWPSWLLIGTIVTSLAAVTKIIPVQYVVELRLLYAVGVGITLGIYICAEFFIQAPILHALLVGAVTCASIFVVFTHLPSSSSP
ncbi:hypothetical protein KI387_000816, partial [Taxus chinensis]